MGGVFCALAAKVFRFDAKKRHLSASVLIAGLPASGKTTVLCKLIWLQQHHHGLKRLDFKRYDFKRRDGKASFKTSPTVGFNVEEVKCHHTKMTIWEVGSSDYMRNLEARSLEENDGLIFVIDSSDRARISESRVELLRILNLRTSISNKPVSAPILILANKQDQTEALTVKELSELLNLKNVLSCPWHIQPTCALTGAGVTEGFTWLASALKESSNNNQLC